MNLKKAVILFISTVSAIMFTVDHVAWAGNMAQPSIAILPLSDVAGRKASAALIEALSATKKAEMIPLSKVEASMGNSSSQSSSGAITEAQKNLDTGRKAYDALDFKKAQSLLSTAKKQFRALPNEEEAFEGIRSSQIQLALLYLAKKQNELAQKELTEMYLWDPERENRVLSTKQYSPSILKIYESVQVSFKDKLNAALVVETDPEGAIVYIDGKMLGPSPASLLRLPQGTHAVYVTLEGYKSQRVDKGVVAGNNEVSVSLEKQAETQSMRFKPVKTKEELDHTQVAFLDSLSTKLHADMFVFLSPGRSEISAQLYDQRSQEVSKVVTGKSPEELAKKLIAQTNASGYVIAGGNNEDEEVVTKNDAIINPKIRESQLAQERQNAPTPRQHSDKPSIWSSPWLWGSIGAIALVGVGGYFGYEKYLKNDSTTTLKIPVPGR